VLATMNGVLGENERSGFSAARKPFPPYEFPEG